MHRRSRLLMMGASGAFLLLLLLPLQVFAAFSNVSQPYSVSGKPTLSAAQINQILAAYHSPAANKGEFLYNEGLKYGIDPAVALAFFMHESSFGNAGIARQSFSLGNLRCIPQVECKDGFAWFPNWEAGFHAWFVLIYDLYIHTWNLTTVEQIIPRYAPAADNNNEAAYINAVEDALDTWRSGEILVGQPLAQDQSPQSVRTTPTTTATPTPLPEISAEMITEGGVQHSILGRPSVSVQFIDQLLTKYHSPSAGKGQLFYDEGVKYGIDPAFALAFFMRESVFGTVGVARVTHSIGQIPTPVTAECRCQDFQGYRQYENWDDGIQDWYREVHERYLLKDKTTLEQIVPLYLLTRNTVTLKAFVRAVTQRVNQWQKQQSSSTNTEPATQPTPAPATVLDTDQH